MHQALAQEETRNVKVEDGWLYFLHGWTQVIAQVLHIEVGTELFDRLATIAGRDALRLDWCWRKAAIAIAKSIHSCLVR